MVQWCENKEIGKRGRCMPVFARVGVMSVIIGVLIVLVFRSYGNIMLLRTEEFFLRWRDFLFSAGWRADC